MKRPSTETIVKALRIVADDMDAGVSDRNLSPECLREAADRLTELEPAWIEPALVVTLTESDAASGYLAMRKWDNLGLPAGTHTLYSLGKAE